MLKETTQKQSGEVFDLSTVKRPTVDFDQRMRNLVKTTEVAASKSTIKSASEILRLARKNIHCNRKSERPEARTAKAQSDHPTAKSDPEQGGQSSTLSLRTQRYIVVAAVVLMAFGLGYDTGHFLKYILAISFLLVVIWVSFGTAQVLRVMAPVSAVINEDHPEISKSIRKSVDAAAPKVDAVLDLLPPRMANRMYLPDLCSDNR